MPIALNTVNCLGPQAEAKKHINNVTQKHHPEKWSGHNRILSHRLTIGKMSEVYICLVDIIAWPRAGQIGHVI